MCQADEFSSSRTLQNPQGDKNLKIIFYIPKVSRKIWDKIDRQN